MIAKQTNLLATSPKHAIVPYVTDPGLKRIERMSIPFQMSMFTPKSLWWCSWSHFLCLLPVIHAVLRCKFMVISHVLIAAHFSPLLHDIYLLGSAVRRRLLNGSLHVNFRLHSFGHNVCWKRNFVTVAIGGNRRQFQHFNEPSTNTVRCLDETILWAKCNGGIINSVDVQYVST